MSTVVGAGAPLFSLHSLPSFPQPNEEETKTALVPLSAGNGSPAGVSSQARNMKMMMIKLPRDVNSKLYQKGLEIIGENSVFYTKYLKALSEKQIKTPILEQQAAIGVIEKGFPYAIMYIENSGRMFLMVPISKKLVQLSNYELTEKQINYHVNKDLIESSIKDLPLSDNFEEAYEALVQGQKFALYPSSFNLNEVAVIFQNAISPKMSELRTFTLDGPLRRQINKQLIKRQFTPIPD